MGIMDFFKKEKRTKPTEEELRMLEQLRMLTGIKGISDLELLQGDINNKQALNIPNLAASINLISSTIAMIPICLYSEKDNEVIELKDDERVQLLNEDTGDTLDAYQMKKRVVFDYFLNGNGYIYINRSGNSIKSLHYVDCKEVSINKNFNPIFKDADFLVQGETYRTFDFIKLLRNTKDGFEGEGIVDQTSDFLKLIYDSFVYERNTLSSGGNKRGFFKSTHDLDERAMEQLRIAADVVYSNNKKVAVLNSGLDFQELSNTSVEMQLADNKKENLKNTAILLNLSEKIISGTATTAEYNSFIKIVIMPILTEFKTALNKELLLNSEKQTMFFDFDTKEILKADIKERYEAYEIASKNGFLQTDEIRYLENVKPLGFDFIKLGLQDVLYNPVTGEIFTPNTGQTQNLNKIKTLKGGEE